MRKKLNKPPTALYPENGTGLTSEVGNSVSFEDVYKTLLPEDSKGATPICIPVDPNDFSQ